MFERGFLDQQNLVDQLGDDLAGECTRRLDRNPFGQRIAAAGAIITGYSGIHRRIQLGLHPDHLDRGLERLGDRCHPAHQPAAADRHDEAIEIVLLGQHFERHRALPRSDQRIVEGMDES